MSGCNIFEINFGLCAALTVVGAVLTISPIAVAPAYAGNECLLDTNNNGTATTGVDTVGGASASGGSDATACGSNATATSIDSTAVGSDTIANSIESTAIGTDAEANGRGATAVGHDAHAGRVTLVTRVVDGATAIGAETNVYGAGGTAIGRGATVQVGAVQGVAIGDDARASAIGSIAIGGNTSNANFSGNLGARSRSTYSIAIGAEAQTGNGAIGSIAIGGDANNDGFGASTSSKGAIAIGQDAVASGLNSIAQGANSVASGFNSIAQGNGAQATGTNAIAIGNGAIATGSVAIGASAAAGNGGTAIGDFTSAQGANSSALGANASAAHTNSSAIGTGATTTRANQIVLGTSSSTITAPGIASSASRAAQGTVVGVVTTDAAGNLASDGGALQAQVNALTSDNDALAEGIAMAFALKSAYVPADKKFALTGGLGFFQDKTAFASSIGFRINQNVQLDGGLAVGLDSRDVGGRVGITVTW